MEWNIMEYMAAVIHILLDAHHVEHEWQMRESRRRENRLIPSAHHQTFSCITFTPGLPLIKNNKERRRARRLCRRATLLTYRLHSRWASLSFNRRGRISSLGPYLPGIQTSPATSVQVHAHMHAHVAVNSSRHPLQDVILSRGDSEHLYLSFSSRDMTSLFLSVPFKQIYFKVARKMKREKLGNILKIRS